MNSIYFCIMLKNVVQYGHLYSFHSFLQDIQTNFLNMAVGIITPVYFTFSYSLLLVQFIRYHKLPLLSSTFSKIHQTPNNVEEQSTSKQPSTFFEQFFFFPFICTALHALHAFFYVFGSFSVDTVSKYASN
jgi:hypothetical protein